MDTKTTTKEPSAPTKMYVDPNKRMRVPKAYLDAKFSDLKGIDTVITQAKEAIDNGKSVTFTAKPDDANGKNYPSVGIGKTHLAVCLMRYWWAKNQPPLHEAPLFVSIPDLIMEIKDSWNKEDGSEKDIIDFYTRPKLVIFDDLGVGNIGDWARGVFYSLIDKRMRDEKQTIITSNLTLGGIANVIDVRLSSRLKGMGPIMTLGTKDWRKG